MREDLLTANKTITELKSQIWSMEEQLSEKDLEIGKRDEQIVKFHEFNPWEEMVKAKEKEILFMQSELLAVREEISKIKQKSSKKSKIYYIEHWSSSIHPFYCRSIYVQNLNSRNQRPLKYFPPFSEIKWILPVELRIMHNDSK